MNSNVLAIQETGREQKTVLCEKRRGPEHPTTPGGVIRRVAGFPLRHLYGFVGLCGYDRWVCQICCVWCVVDIKGRGAGAERDS